MANMAQHLLDTASKEGVRPALRMGDPTSRTTNSPIPPAGSPRRWPHAA
jgi:hypothetical protein